MGSLHITTIVASLALLALIWQRDRARTSRQRAGMFDLCIPLQIEPQLTERRGDFPLLTGRYRAETFALEAFPDTLGYRKIPSLWMQVTVAMKLPVSGTIDILARAQNIEFFRRPINWMSPCPLPPVGRNPCNFAPTISLR